MPLPSVPRRLAACWLALALLLPACAPLAPRPSAAPATPDEAYPELFEAVQTARLFEDQKRFADAVPRRDPAAIRAEYLAARARPGFDLAAFVASRFALPPDVATAAVAPQPTLRAHIDALWPLLTRRAEPAAHDSLLPLPRPYVVPGGRFREVYYWDSWFTMLGLAESGRDDLSRGMLENFAHLLDAWGRIPNGNRSYYLGRSQPPFFSHMVALEARDDPAVLRRYLPQLRREHAFWMAGEGDLAPGAAHRRVVRLADGSLLNRYWDDRDTPRPESFVQDRETAAEAARPPAEVYRNLRAGAESGWDYSSRWLDDGRSLHGIRTTAILPVDLNSLLHHLESTIAQGCALDAQPECAREFAGRAERRRAAIEAHLWHPDGYYADSDLRTGRPRDALTAAAFYPLFAGLAAPARARATARAARVLLRPGGLATTPVESGQQWDAPNAWAPLQWVAVDGLARYGEDAFAREIARNFLGNVQAVYARERKLVEKYDAEGPRGGGGGEYPLQDGFGWTNGVVLALFGRYPELEADAPPAAR